ncbi:MAG: sensor histidine kinase, partial [Verrucomicrobiota bacterium]
PGPGRGGRFPGLPGGAVSLRARLNFPLYWVLVSVAHALLFYRRAQDRERRALELAASLAEARLRALRMQLQPHFLFNTLNAIATLVHENPAAADDMIASLSDFLRLTLERGDRPEQPLRDELEFLDRYLEIERVRFGDRLQVRREIDPATLDTRVPTLLLQPLVENAVRHGLEPRRETGIITLTARRDGPGLHLAVADNGVGWSKAIPVREGVGLANTRARLHELHGAHASLALAETPGGGATVVILLPAPAPSPATPVPTPR